MNVDELEDEDCAETIEEALDWASYLYDYNTEFLESLQRQIENGRKLSHKQKESLVRSWNYLERKIKEFDR